MTVIITQVLLPMSKIVTVILGQWVLLSTIQLKLAKWGKKWIPRKNEKAKSVINPECQVHGTSGLSIADASV